MPNHSHLKKRHTNLIDEIETEEPDFDHTNNIIIGIVIGVTIMLCGIIYVVGSLMSI